MYSDPNILKHASSPPCVRKLEALWQGLNWCGFYFEFWDLESFFVLKFTNLFDIKVRMNTEI